MASGIEFHLAKISSRYGPAMWWQRLETVMKARDMTAADLSRASGVDYDRLAKYLQGKVEQPRGDTMVKLARALATTEEFLRLGRSLRAASYDPDIPEQPLDPDAPPNPSSFPPDAVRELAAKAGLGNGQVIQTTFRRDGAEHVAQDEVLEDYWQLPRHYVRDAMQVRTVDLLVVNCAGQSMEPTLKSSDRVFVDTSHRKPSPDGLYAIRDDLDEIVVKSLQLIPGNPPRLRIISDNPTWPASERGLEEVAVVGRVVAVMKLV